MSRSCHSAMSCMPACRLPRKHARQATDGLGRDRIALVRHGRRALLTGLEPFHAPRGPRCAAGGAAPPRSARSSSRPTAQAHRYSAWRSRAMTCVAGTGTSPSRSATYRSTDGSTFEYVPTAPLSLHTITARRAARSRSRSRSICSAHRATLAPNVVGSACTPWVRPIIDGVAVACAPCRPAWSAAASRRRSAGRQHRAASSTTPCRPRRCW